MQVFFGRDFIIDSDEYICSKVPSKTLPHPPENRVSPIKRIGFLSLKKNAI